MPREGTLILFSYIHMLVDLMLIVTLIVGFCNCSMFCCAYFLQSS